MSRVLGIILAGGQSRRFGSDKAVASLDGTRLIDRVVAAVTPQVDGVRIVGRAGGLTDRPTGGVGPLAGINAGLHHALANGYEWVVSVPCDAPILPGDLVERLRGDASAYVIDSPVIGLWSAAHADRLDRHLEGNDRSMRGWTRTIGARAVDLGPIANVNTIADLDRLSARSAAPQPA